MTEKILMVDDDPHLLASYERSFRRRFTILTAGSGVDGLAKLADHGPFAVVVADRHMPQMDGIELLSHVRALAPDTVRIMLTGNADLEAAIRVVNEGNIFRFLTKPCDPDVLTKALADALTQYRLVTNEKELLNRTLSGSIKLLTDILSLVEPRAFSRSQALRQMVVNLTDRLGLANAWEIHLAVMLAAIGQVTIPPDTLVKARSPERLSEAEQGMLTRLPAISSRLLANIPRLEGVARIVLYQRQHFDGSGFPADGIVGELIPLGARLLKILSDLIELQSKGLTAPQALAQMESRPGVYDPVLLATVRAANEGIPAAPPARVCLSLPLKDLAPGMILRSNVETKDGLLLLSVGHELEAMTLEKVRNFGLVGGIREPILVEADAPPPSQPPGVV